MNPSRQDSSPALEGSLAAVGLALVLSMASCTVQTESAALGGEPVATASQEIHSSHAGPAPWKHVLTCYGGCEAPHYDSSACNHHTSCGPIANGKWWYATERAAFHCGAKLKIVRGNKCVVVDVQDNGPADWVESNADAKCGTPYIIDASPLVADYFGGGCGWGECFLVDVSPVADDTPTGPDGCNTCDCTPGQVDTAECGNCGTHKRTCGGDCHWSGWSACEGQGPCAPGQKQSQGCCDCGSQERTCGGNCQWNGWSACEGPDPNGGADACDTGQSGPCAQGRKRCQHGCLGCVRIYDPQPEKCDAIDNDCNGSVDDGHPTVMGDSAPAYAAKLEDFSARASLAPGEIAEVWASFRNVGSKPWLRGKAWIGSVQAASGSASPLYAADHWPAWDVAGVLDSDVPVGASAYVKFFIQAPSKAGAKAHDEFQLVAPDGTLVNCPTPSVEVDLSVSSMPASRTHGEAKDEPQAACGCRQERGRSAAASGWWIAALALSLWQARRARSQVAAGTRTTPAEGSEHHVG
ncbi:MAG: hypothetical protein HY898_30645 [Deltaproteobacteria bacterium]|nr:hypothetical protein [Deltaproteobacteria bacterium]